MAHSTRNNAKKNGSYISKNKAMKSQRASKQADRLRELTRWADEKHLKKEVKVEVKKTKRIPMNSGVKRRRQRVLSRLEFYLKYGTKCVYTITEIPPHHLLTQDNVKRIEKEIKTLKNRT